MSKFGDNLKKMIDIFDEYRLYSPYYRKMAVVFLILMVLSFITLFIKDNPGKLGAVIGLIVLIMFPVIIYYGVRVGFDVYKAGKKTLSKEKTNKFLRFYDFIYIYVIFLDPLVRKLVTKFLI